MIQKILNKYSFALLSIIGIISFLRVFNENVILLDDTINNFYFFYFFYNEFFLTGEIAQWMPHQFYGSPSQYWQIAAISIISYPVMLVGSIFKITNVLFLYKFTILCEHLVLLCGMYKLCNLLFKQKITTFILCIATIMNIQWTHQIFFNFRIISMFPLALYFYLSFFTKKDMRYLLYTMITFLAWWMGSTIYFICIWIFVFFIIGVVLFLKDKKILKQFKSLSLQNIILLAIGILSSVCIFYQLKNFGTFASVGREINDGYKVPLEMFLKYGGILTLPQILEKLLMGNGDGIYIGIIPLLLFIWSLFKVRDHKYYSFLIAAGAIAWLSFGGMFSFIAYYFPLMSTFRHIGFIHMILKILLLICAGYGLENFLSIELKRKCKYLISMLIALIFLIDGLGLSASWLTNFNFSSEEIKHWYMILKDHPDYHRTIILILCFLFFNIFFLFAILPNKAFKKTSSENLFLFALLIFFFLDMKGQHFLNVNKLKLIPSEYTSMELFNVHSSNLSRSATNRTNKR